MSTAGPQTEAILNHVRRDSLVNRRFVFPGDEVNTGKFEPHRVAIHNARLADPKPTLATHGFELFRHASAMQNFVDRDEIDRIYAGEVVEAIANITGADLVVPMGATLRTAGDTAGSRQPPAADVHCDTSPTFGPRLAQMMFQPYAEQGKTYRRSLVTSLWRTFSPAPQDWPLALCDGNSVAPEEGVHNYLVRLASRPTPEQMLAPIEGEEDLPAALIFRHGPHHRWYYYPDMTRDEIVLIKLNDSDRGQTWFAPHTAFHDRGRAGAHPRESIEFRSVAYWL
ncbi:MAG TPA: CmcJ/NvfI family oxidoreductase [Stellaceae bacterium]|nr:CmcJ/NvfI family oxidoreductase [Stellaceae bacterium]